jgi:glycosyltransferase involved in cell wall biosynthesis
LKNKKILHVVSISFSLKYFIGNQFIHFKNKGYEFSVACSPSDDLNAYSKEMNFKVARVSIIRQINPFQDIIAIFNLYKYIKKEKFDIVIAHSPKGGLVGMTAAFLARTPRRIFFRHGLVFETAKFIKKRILILVEKWIGFLSHKVVSVSPSILERTKFFKLNSSSKNIILSRGTCNGLDLNKFKFRNKKNNLISEENIVVGFVGRLCKDKGIIELIDAWKIVEEKNKLVKLLLVGPFDDRDLLPDHIIKIIKTNPNIIHIGQVDDVSPFYNEMDIFILPSFREGFPTVVLEASASELPIITTRNTGCVDSIIENETGIFTELESIKIAINIQFYIDNPLIRMMHGKNGRLIVEKYFDEKIIYNEIEKLILE